MFAGKSVSRERRGPFPGCPGLVGVGETRLAGVAERRTIHRIGFPDDVQLARSSSKLSRAAVDCGFVRDHREQGLRNRLRCGNRRIKENVVARVGNPVMLDMENHRAPRTGCRRHRQCSGDRATQISRSRAQSGVLIDCAKIGDDTAANGFAVAVRIHMRILSRLGFRRGMRAAAGKQSGNQDCDRSK